jgi:hypothetical protein
MSKANKVLPSDLLITSLRDAGYKASVNATGMAAIAQYVVGKDSTFSKAKKVGDIAETTRAELTSGFLLHAAELWDSGSKAGFGEYGIGEGGTLIKLADNQAWKGERIAFTVAYVMSWTQQALTTANNKAELGAAKYAHIVACRSEVSKHASDNFKRLMSAAQNLLDKVARKRGETKLFTDSQKAKFVEGEKSVKSAKARGDTTANPEKYGLAIKAFWTAYSA